MNTYKVITGEGETRKVSTCHTIISALMEVFRAKQDGRPYAVFNESTGKDITSNLTPVITGAVDAFDTTAALRPEYMVSAMPPYDPPGLSSIDLSDALGRLIDKMKASHPMGEIVVYRSCILPNGTVYASADVYDAFVTRNKEGK